MRKSRTIRTCEDIVLTLIKAYGPQQGFPQKFVEAAIVERAGGDPRTVSRYMKQLVGHKFLFRNSDGMFTVNLKRVDFQQVTLRETMGLMMNEDDEPP